jgi:hypothetical protein
MNRLGIIFIVLVVTASYSRGQCDAAEKIKVCAPAADSGYTLIKSFEVDGQTGNKSEVKYSYVFTKGTQYLISICGDDNSADGVVVTLYDKYRNEVATSLIDGVALNAISYPCTATGIYYITYTFNDSKHYCAGSTIGFKRIS